MNNDLKKINKSIYTKEYYKKNSKEIRDRENKKYITKQIRYNELKNKKNKTLEDYKFIEKYEEDRKNQYERNRLYREKHKVITYKLPKNKIDNINNKIEEIKNKINIMYPEKKEIDANYYMNYYKQEYLKRKERKENNKYNNYKSLFSYDYGYDD